MGSAKKPKTTGSSRPETSSDLESNQALVVQEYLRMTGRLPRPVSASLQEQKDTQSVDDPMLPAVRSLEENLQQLLREANPKK